MAAAMASLWSQFKNLRLEIDSSEVAANKTSNLEDLFNLFKTSRLSQAQLEHM
jgi:hypothetical protein